MSDVSESSGTRFGSIGDRSCEKNSPPSCDRSHGSPCQTAHYDDRLHPLSADGWRALVRIREREIDDATRVLRIVLPPFTDLSELAHRVVAELLSLRHDVADLRDQITALPTSQEAANTQAALQAEIERLRDELRVCEENRDYAQERAAHLRSVADKLEARERASARRARVAEQALSDLEVRRRAAKSDLLGVLGIAESADCLEDLTTRAIAEISSLSREIDSANEALRGSLGLPDTNTESLKDLVARVSTALTPSPDPAKDEASPATGDAREDRIALMRDQLAMLFLRNATAACTLSALLPFDLGELPEGADALTAVIGRIEKTWREREERIAALSSLTHLQPDAAELNRKIADLEAQREAAGRQLHELLSSGLPYENFPTAVRDVSEWWREVHGELSASLPDSWMRDAELLPLAARVAQYVKDLSAHLLKRSADLTAALDVNERQAERIKELAHSKPSDAVAEPGELLRLKNILEDRDTAIRMAREALQRKMGLDSSNNTTLLELIEKAPIVSGWPESLLEERAEIRAILIDIYAEQDSADRRASTWELAASIRYVVAEASKQLRLVLDMPSGDRSPLLALTEKIAIQHTRVRDQAQRDLASMKQAADKRAQDLIDAGARAMVRLAEAGVPTSDAKSLEDAAFATGKLIADLKSSRDQIARRYATAAADAVIRLCAVGVPAIPTASLEDAVEAAVAHIRNLKIAAAVRAEGPIAASIVRDTLIQTCDILRTAGLADGAPHSEYGAISLAEKARDLIAELRAEQATLKRALDQREANIGDDD